MIIITALEVFILVKFIIYIRKNKLEVLAFATLWLLTSMVAFLLSYPFTIVFHGKEESIVYERTNIYFSQEENCFERVDKEGQLKLDVLNGDGEKETFIIDKEHIKELKTSDIYETVFEVYRPLYFKQEYWYQYIYTTPHYLDGYYVAIIEPSAEALSQFKKMS